MPRLRLGLGLLRHKHRQADILQVPQVSPRRIGEVKATQRHQVT